MFSLANIIVILILLTTIILSIRKPIYGCLIFLWVHNLIPNVTRLGSISLNTVIIIIVLIAQLILYPKMHHDRRDLRKSFYYFIILFVPMLLTTTAALLLNIDNLPLPKSYGQIIQSFIADFLPFTVVFLSINDDSDCVKVERTFLKSITAVALYGIFTAIINSNPLVEYFATATGSSSELFLVGGTRGAIESVATGNMSDSLSWGQICIVYLSFVIFDPLFKNKRWKLSLIILLSANCLLTTKRSAIIPMLVLDVYWSITVGLYKRKSFFYIVGVFVVAIICFVKIPSLHKIYEQNIQTAIFWWNTDLAEDQGVSGSSMEMRMGQFRYVEQLISQSPLIGNGAGFKNDFQYRHGTNTYAYGFESFVLFVLADYGWIGLFFWLYFFYYNMKLTRGCTTTNNNFRSAALHIPYILALLLTGFFSSVWGYMVLVAIFSKFSVSKKIEIENK